MKSTRSDALIAQLYGGKWHLNSDERGQVHFYGLTPSLHLKDDTLLSFLSSGRNLIGHDHQVQVVPAQLQMHLLDLYWKYLHPVLQIVHREAFLHDMTHGLTRYCNKLLVYCMLACGARMSEESYIRGLALREDDEMNEEQPFLVKRAFECLEQELKRPGITTIQALQLLSVIDCARSNNTKGWLLSSRCTAFGIRLRKQLTGIQGMHAAWPLTLACI